MFSPRKAKSPPDRSSTLFYGDGSEPDDDDPVEVTKPTARKRQQDLTPWSFLTYDREKMKRPGSLSATSWIGWVNVVAYGIQVAYPSFTRWGLKLSDKITRGEDLYRLVSPIFLHGGLIHLATNTLSLSSVGPQVESYFGTGRFLATYLVSGIAGNVVSAYKSPNPALGASGAVFGIIGACAVFLLRNDGLFGARGDAMVQSLTRTIGVNLLFGAMMPMVDNWAHLGGLMGGAGFATMFGPRLVIATLPNGRQTIVDRPILRLPTHIESIPGKIGGRFNKIKRRMQVNLFKSDLREEPWRTKPNRSNFQRQGVRDRSIRPLDVDP